MFAESSETRFLVQVALSFMGPFSELFFASSGGERVE